MQDFVAKKLIQRRQAAYPQPMNPQQIFRNHPQNPQNPIGQSIIPSLTPPGMISPIVQLQQNTPSIIPMGPQPVSHDPIDQQKHYEPTKQAGTPYIPIHHNPNTRNAIFNPAQTAQSPGYLPPPQITPHSQTPNPRLNNNSIIPSPSSSPIKLPEFSPVVSPEVKREAVKRTIEEQFKQMWDENLTKSSEKKQDTVVKGQGNKIRLPCGDEFTYKELRKSILVQTGGAVSSNLNSTFGIQIIQCPSRKCQYLLSERDLSQQGLELNIQKCKAIKVNETKNDVQKKSNQAASEINLQLTCGICRSNYLNLSRKSVPKDELEKLVGRKFPRILELACERCFPKTLSFYEKYCDRIKVEYQNSFEKYCRSVDNFYYDFKK